MDIKLRIRAVAPNPKRQGTTAYRMYSVYEPGMLVSEYLVCDRRARVALRHDIEHGYVTVR